MDSWPPPTRDQTAHPHPQPLAQLLAQAHTHGTGASASKLGIWRDLGLYRDDVALYGKRQDAEDMWWQGGGGGRVGAGSADEAGAGGDVARLYSPHPSLRPLAGFAQVHLFFNRRYFFLVWDLPAFVLMGGVAGLAGGWRRALGGWWRMGGARAHRPAYPGLPPPCPTTPQTQARPSLPSTSA